MTDTLCECGHDIDEHAADVDCLGCLRSDVDHGVSSTRCILKPSDIARALLIEQHYTNMHHTRDW